MDRKGSAISLAQSILSDLLKDDDWEGVRLQALALYVAAIDEGLYEQFEGESLLTSQTIDRLVGSDFRRIVEEAGYWEP